MRLIDVNKLKENLITEIYSYSKGDIRKRLFARGLSLAYDIVNKQPTVEPKHGYWKMIPQYGAECSECGLARFEIVGIPYTNVKSNYCPNCGAKMDEVTE